MAIVNTSLNKLILSNVPIPTKFCNVLCYMCVWYFMVTMQCSLILCLFSCTINTTSFSIPLLHEDGFSMVKNS